MFYLQKCKVDLKYGILLRLFSILWQQKIRLGMSNLYLLEFKYARNLPKFPGGIQSLGLTAKTRIFDTYRSKKKLNTYVYKQHNKSYVSLKFKSILSMCELLKYFKWISNKKFLIINKYNMCLRTKSHLSIKWSTQVTRQHTYSEADLRLRMTFESQHLQINTNLNCGPRSHTWK